MNWPRELFDFLVFSSAASFLVLAVATVATWFARRPAVRKTVICWALAGCWAAPLAVLIPSYSQLSTTPVRDNGATPRSLTAQSKIAAARSTSPSAPVKIEITESGARPVAEPRIPFGWRQAVVSAWLAGLAVSFAWWLAGLFRLWRLLHRSIAATADAKTALVEVAGDAAARVRLLESDSFQQPIACWWGRPVIVLPTGHKPSADARAVRWQVAHEWAHLENGDALSWLFASLTRALFYFQPLCWLLCRQLRFDQDLLADARAAKAADDAEDYAAFLITCVRQSTRLPAPALGMAAGRSQLYRRVVMLLKHRDRLESSVSSPRRAVIAALFLIAIVAAAALPLPRLGNRGAASVLVAQESVATQPTTPEAPERKGTSANVPREELRYADKSFEQWKRVLQRDLDPETQIKAIRALAALGANGYADEVAGLLAEVLEKQTGSNVHVAALIAARHLGPPAIDLIRQASKHEEEAVRNNAATALKAPNQESDVALPILAELLDDASVTVRLNAVDSIGAYGEKAKPLAPRLRTILRDESSSQLRAKACWALGMIGQPDDETTQALLDAIDDSGTRSEAAMATIAYGGDTPEIRNALIDALLDDFTPQHQFRQQINVFRGGPRRDFVAELLIGALAELDLGEGNRANDIMMRLNLFGPPKSAETVLRRWLVRPGVSPNLAAAQSLVRIESLDEETIAEIRAAAQSAPKGRQPERDREWRSVLRQLGE